MSPTSFESFFEGGGIVADQAYVVHARGYAETGAQAQGRPS
ncbi:hypothetical protein [Sphingomonas sp. PP-CC-3A-396]|nr:hypothetical protein [Sphingomonas sp. PP-CC-3A-396]